MSFFFNDTATTEIYTLSLHDALPISVNPLAKQEYDEAMAHVEELETQREDLETALRKLKGVIRDTDRSEEHTSELQSRQYLVCRLLLEKKKKNKIAFSARNQTTYRQR